MLLYCVSHAGASAMNFLKWKPLLKKSISLYPLEMAGRGIKHSQPIYTSFSEAVQDLFVDFKESYTGGSFALFGHSLGGWLVYELYYYIKNQLHICPQHVFISGIHPPDVPYNKVNNLSLQDSVLMDMISQFQGEEIVSLDSEILEELKKVLKNDLMLVKNYQYKKKQELIQSPITILSGTRDPKVTNQQLLGWKSFAESRCTLCKIKGDHFYPFNNMEETISILNSTLIPY